MRVLIVCERSGVVRRAFRALGHDAWSCDLEPADDGSPFHIQGDAIRAILSGHWDLLIAHPPCQYLSSSGLHWNGRVPGRAEKTEEAVAFALALWGAKVPRVCLENPVGRLGTTIGPSNDFLQPYEFASDASKGTCLVAHPTKPGKFLPRWGNQTDSGQNKLTPSPDRSKLRSETYPGIAASMAQQWGCL